MRKRKQKKRRACALCKPHKRGKENRIVGKVLADMKSFEKMKKEVEDK